MENKTKNRIIYISTIVISIIFIFCGYKLTSSRKQLIDNESASVKAKIVRIADVKDTEMTVAGDTYLYRIVYFSAEILTGENKGKTVDAAQVIDKLYMIQQQEVSVGKKVFLCENADNSVNADLVFSEYVRTDALIALGLVFCVLLVLFGRFKGVNTLLSLAFTCLAVFMVFIPSVLAGMNIYLWSILVCIYITIMTLLLVNGANAKSLAAGVGCVGGVFIAGALMKFMDIFLRLTGNTDECSVFLAQLNPDDPIDLKALIFAAIIIGAVGAIMDVAMSMASSLHELREKTPDVSVLSLCRSGIAIGRDIMGTMANTLVLAYIGSSLCTVLLLFVYNASFMEVMNRELIIVEILQALVGSFGILFAIPLTTVVSAMLYTGHGSKDMKNLVQKRKKDGDEKKSVAPMQDGNSDYYDSLY